MKSFHSGGRFSITIVKCLLNRKLLSNLNLMAYSSTFLMFYRKYLESMQIVYNYTLVFRLVSYLANAYLVKSKYGFSNFCYSKMTPSQLLPIFLIDKLSQYTPPVAVSVKIDLMILQSIKANLKNMISFIQLVMKSKVQVKQMRAFRMYLPTSRQEKCPFQWPYASICILPISYLMNQRGVILSLYLRVSSLIKSTLTFYEMAGSLGIFRQLLSISVISLGIELSSNGQFPNSISYKITPIDHKSALESYASPFSISGAIQMGDPTIV